MCHRSLFELSVESKERSFYTYSDSNCDSNKGPQEFWWEGDVPGSVGRGIISELLLLIWSCELQLSNDLCEVWYNILLMDYRSATSQAGSEAEN